MEITIMKIEVKVGVKKNRSNVFCYPNLEIYLQFETWIIINEFKLAMYKEEENN